MICFVLFAAGYTVYAQYDAAWDIAIKDRVAGKSDYIAIQDVYEYLPPPATPTSVAIIIGAVYADNYWVNIKMDYSLLSAALQKAIGWGRDDCDKAAQMAFSSWYGILLRKSFDDAGKIPNTSPSVCNSPEIVCNADAPLTISLLLRRWNEYFWNYGNVGKNYVYVRGASYNFIGNIEKAKAQAYYSEAGFNIPPQSWQILYTLTRQTSLPMQGMQEGPLKAGDRAVSNDAFIFEPPSATKHYCLIGVVSTEFFENNPSKINPGGNWNTAVWLSYDGAAAWHNIGVTNDTESGLKFYNQDNRPEMFAFEAHCSNLPPGTEVSLSCRDPKVLMDIKPLRVTAKYHVVSTEVEVPANFTGDLIVRIKNPQGKYLPANASVEVRMMWLLTHGHQHYIQAANMLGAHDAAKEFRELRVPMGNFTFVGKSSR